MVDGMGLGGGAEVAQLALAGGGGVEAERHGESVTAGGASAWQQFAARAVSKTQICL